MMTPEDHAKAETVHAGYALELIENWLNGIPGAPPDGYCSMIVNLSDGRTVGITIEDMP